MSRSWAARHFPVIRRDYVAVTRQGMLARQRALEHTALAGLVRDSLAHSERLALAELFWVTRDMAAQALDASTDMPVFDPGVLPCPHGWIGFAEPLPAAEVEFADAGGKVVLARVPIWAVSWLKEPEGYLLEAWTRTEDLGEDLLTVPGAALQGVAEFKVSSTEVSEIDSLPVPRLASGRPAEFMRALVALVGACCTLMMTPTLVERRELDGRRGTAARPDTRDDDLVSLIDLRPLRRRDDWRERESGAAAREYKHRWVVRGHWRQQPYGPGRSLRRQQYIEPYIAGPEGAPFKATEKVMVWRR